MTEMGFWYETCMLTGLPVLPGEKCAGFLIARNNVPRGRTWPTSFWRPVTPPLFGEYDGYGGLADIQNGTCVPWLLTANDAAYKYRSAYEPVPGPDMLKEALSLVKDANLYVKPDHGPREPVALAVVKRRFFNMAVEMAMNGLDLSSGAYEIGNAYGVDPPIQAALGAGRVDEKDVRRLKAFEAFLAAARKSWGPVTGAGKQDAVSRPFLLDFQAAVLDEARDIHRKNN